MVGEQNDVTYFFAALFVAFWTIQRYRRLGLDWKNATALASISAFLVSCIISWGFVLEPLIVETYTNPNFPTLHLFFVDNTTKAFFDVFLFSITTGLFLSSVFIFISSHLPHKKKVLAVGCSISLALVLCATDITHHLYWYFSNDIPYLAFLDEYIEIITFSLVADLFAGTVTGAFLSLILYRLWNIFYFDQPILGVRIKDSLSGQLLAISTILLTFLFFCPIFYFGVIYRVGGPVILHASDWRSFSATLREPIASRASREEKYRNPEIPFLAKWAEVYNLSSDFAETRIKLCHQLSDHCDSRLINFATVWLPYYLDIKKIDEITKIISKYKEEITASEITLHTIPRTIKLSATGISDENIFWLEMPIERSVNFERHPPDDLFLVEWAQRRQQKTPPEKQLFVSSPGNEIGLSYEGKNTIVVGIASQETSNNNNDELAADEESEQQNILAPRPRFFVTLMQGGRIIRNIETKEVDQVTRDQLNSIDPNLDWKVEALIPFLIISAKDDEENTINLDNLGVVNFQRYMNSFLTSGMSETEITNFRSNSVTGSLKYRHADNKVSLGDGLTIIGSTLALNDYKDGGFAVFGYVKYASINGKPINPNLWQTFSAEILAALLSGLIAFILGRITAPNKTRM